jgi:hypothetical protein
VMLNQVPRPNGMRHLGANHYKHRLANGSRLRRNRHTHTDTHLLTQQYLWQAERMHSIGSR